MRILLHLVIYPERLCCCLCCDLLLLLIQMMLQDPFDPLFCQPRRDPLNVPLHFQSSTRPTLQHGTGGVLVCGVL